MKILFIASELKAIGGTQRYNKSFYQTLIESGQDVDLVELKSGNFIAKVQFSLQIFIETIKFKPDFIICTHINFSPIAYYLNKFLKRKYVIFTHGTDVWDIKNKLHIEALKKADVVVSVSQYTKERLEGQIQELKNKVFLLPNMVDGNEFYPKEKSKYLLERHGFKNSDKIILTVARLSAEEQMKGYDKVIMGLPKVIEAIPEIRYLLIGAGTDVPRIKKLIKELKLEDYVIMLGSIPQNSPLLVDYYNLCDIYVMPSVSEGFGIVFIEALACGKPVIAGNLDASSGTLLYGKLGFLVNPNDKNEISETIIKIFNKKVPAYLLDRDYLRNKTLDNYGPEKFRDKITVLLNLIFSR